MDRDQVKHLVAELAGVNTLLQAWLKCETNINILERAAKRTGEISFLPEAKDFIIDVSDGDRASINRRG